MNGGAIKVTVPAIPIAQPRPRAVIVGSGPNAKPGMISAKSKHPVNQFKATCRLTAQTAYDGPPLDGAVSLVVVFVLPRTQDLIWKTKAMPRQWRTKKPDLDNLVKSIKDALTGLLWRDDSQICDMTARKVVAAGDEQPHVEVIVKRLDTEIIA